MRFIAFILWTAALATAQNCDFKEYKSANGLTPEFEVPTGVRRLSEQQAGPLRDLKVAITPEVIEKEKWNAFWDAPLQVPGTGSIGLPRKAEEIRHGSASFHASACEVKTDGA